MARDKTPLERLIANAARSKAGLGNPDDPAVQLYPELYKWLTVTDASDKLTKQAAWLMIRATPGGYVISLTDPSLAVTLDASAACLDELLAALERIVTSPAPPIRPWGRKGLKLTKKPKTRDDES